MSDFKKLSVDRQRSAIKAENAWAVTRVCKVGASMKCTVTHGPYKVDVPGVPLTAGQVCGFGVWFSVLRGVARPLDREVLRTSYVIFLWVSLKELITSYVTRWRCGPPTRSSCFQRRSRLPTSSCKGRRGSGPPSTMTRVPSASSSTRPASHRPPRRLRRLRPR